MKNVLKMIAISIMMATVFSCEKNEAPDKVDMKDSAMTFTADFLGTTKTGFNEGKLTWEAGDKIAVCDGTTVETVTLTATDITSEGASAEIKTKTLATDAAAYYAVFPASCAYTVVDNCIDKTFIKDGCIQISSGAIDLDRSQSFKSYAVASEAGGHFQFKNVGAIVYFKTERNDIAYVKFESNDSDVVRGNVLIDPATGEITRSDYYEHPIYSVKPYIINYYMQDEKEAYIPVIAGITLVGGYTLTAYDSRSKVLGTISTSTDLTFENGKYYTIKNFDSRLHNAIPAGALPGKFSVSADKQVYFSRGNLYWDGVSFEFEASQSVLPSSYWFSYKWDSGHINHFRWSCNASVACAELCNYTRPSPNDVFFTNATDETANPNFTVNGVTGKYRTLSKDEWTYLLSNNQYASVIVKIMDNVTLDGFVIAPDDFDGMLLPSFFDEAELAATNLVFLPRAGYRENFNLYDFNDNGHYWSSSLEFEGDDHYPIMNYIHDNSGTIEIVTGFCADPRYQLDFQRARAVRLVTDVTE